MEKIIETNNLSKEYNGKKVINNINLNLKKGEIYGFVGPNGAGKSTFMKLILNLLKPDYGEIKVFGELLEDENYEILKKIGSIIENSYFYENISAYENLELHCDYMGYYNKEQINEVLKLVKLDNVGNKNINSYSLGMKQRLAIARAILTKPELLILDEPINALDPEGIIEMRELFKKLNEKFGTTILISSHILSEVEQIADTIGIIKEGVLLEEISMDKIHNYNTEYIELEINNIEKASYLIESNLHLTKLKVMSNNILRIYENNIKNSDISRLLIENNIELESISRKKNTLEEYFFRITKEVE